MGRIIAGLLVIILSQAAYAQQDSLDERQVEVLRVDSVSIIKARQIRFRIGVDYYMGSTAITNSFVNSFLFDDFIEEDVKDDVSDKLKSKNRMGVDFGVVLSGYHKGWVFSLINREHMNASFSDNFFELFLRGNKQFAGQTVDLTPLDFTHFNYQELYVGKGNVVSKPFTLALGGSILKGSRFEQLKIDRGDLFTAEDGTSIDYNTNMEITFADQSGSRLGSANGMGASVFALMSKKVGKGKFTFQVRDLGVMQWRNVSYYAADSNYHFEGKDIENVLDFDGSEFEEEGSTELASLLGVEKQTKNVTYLIPARFKAQYYRKISATMASQFELNYRINANYAPRLSATAFFKTGVKHLNVNTTLAYGGYSRGDLDLGVSYIFAERIRAQLNAIFLGSVFLPAKTTGQGFNFAIVGYF